MLSRCRPRRDLLAPACSHWPQNYLTSADLFLSPLPRAVRVGTRHSHFRPDLSLDHVSLLSFLWRDLGALVCVSSNVRLWPSDLLSPQLHHVCNEPEQIFSSSSGSSVMVAETGYWKELWRHQGWSNGRESTLGLHGPD